MNQNHVTKVIVIRSQPDHKDVWYSELASILSTFGAKIVQTLGYEDELPTDIDHKTHIIIVDAGMGLERFQQTIATIKDAFSVWIIGVTNHNDAWETHRILIHNGGNDFFPKLYGEALLKALDTSMSARQIYLLHKKEE